MKSLLSMIVALSVPTLWACGGGSSSADAGTPDARVLPDEREACAENNPLRNAYFGDLHVHTTYSYDAVTFDVRATPDDAYDFAQGQALGLPPYDGQGQPARSVQLDRPLDFAAVTDHAELFAESALCFDSSSSAYTTEICVEYRDSSLAGFNVGGLWGVVAAISPSRPMFCQDADCAGKLREVWDRVQDAAEAAYDRTSACQFTSFVGYEWTGSPVGNNLHRNVIFKNRQAPIVPVSYVEAPWPEELWRQLESNCINAGNGCDALVIPHNPNLSGGLMFMPLSETAQPFTAEQAARRAKMEPLVEIYQHKGSSECTAGLGSPLGAEDELCAFENQHNVICTGMSSDPEDCTRRCSVSGGIGFLGQCADENDFVRTGLGQGLLDYSRVGANPFRQGFVASTDTHNAIPGSVDEAGYTGHQGTAEDTLAKRFEGLVSRSSAGGLVGIWAEENSRESLFGAMQRRETFGTSGPRIAPRFFGSWSYATDLCGRSDMVERGYADGVSMGGVLPARPSGAGAPMFVVSALRDTGTTAKPGTQLQRIQVVKAWVQSGEVRFAVHDVAGDKDNGATVDLNTCVPSGAGADSLCSVWTDPSFDATQPAYYYLRVVENPTCRWNTHQCNAAGVNCATLPASDPLQPCCSGERPATIQERAWTSPIWYEP